MNNEKNEWDGLAKLMQHLTVLAELAVHIHTALPDACDVVLYDKAGFSCVESGLLAEMLVALRWEEGKQE